MSRVNAHVLTELQRLAAEYEAGISEGYDADPNRLPPFCTKRVMDLTARERGHWFGRELREQEVREAQGGQK